MPVIGIESILCKDFRNFQPLILRNKPVIVDGDDFLQYYRPLDRSLWLFGGEYLSMAVLWNDILDQFRHCAIDPLFIIGSHVEKRGQQFKYQVKGTDRILGFLQSFQQGQCNAVPDDLHFPLACTALVDLLDDLCVGHICSPFATHISCASLADLMNCPLFASSPEYLLLSCKLEHLDYSGFDFVPLQCVNPCRFKIKGSNTDFALSTHRFDASRTKLLTVHSSYRPLLFGLLGSDLIPRVRLPKFLYDTMNNTEGADYKARRFATILNWLKQFKPGCLGPFEAVTYCYLTEEKDFVWRALTECLITYLPDPSVGQRLKSFLLTTPSTGNNLDLPVPSVETNFNRSPTSITGHDNAIWKTRFSHLFSNHIRPNQNDFTVDLPKHLVTLTHQSQLGHLILPVLGSSTSVVNIILPQPMESLDIKPSVWDASLKLRVLHYQLLSALQKPSGKKGQREVREFVRLGAKLHCFRIKIQPLKITDNLMSISQFFFNNLGLAIVDVESSSDPLAALSITLAFWHLYSLQTNDTKSDIQIAENSPSILSVLLCAVVNYFNLKTLDKTLVEHYDGVCRSVEESVTTAAKLVNSRVKVRVDYVHSFNSIQISYLFLRSLTGLLNELISARPATKFVFAPAWKIFPSGRLVHWLTGDLWMKDPASRRYAAVRYWMPRLIRPTGDTHFTASILKQAADLFNKSLSLIASVVASSSTGRLKVKCPACPIDSIDLESFKPIDWCSNQPKVTNNLTEPPKQVTIKPTEHPKQVTIKPTVSNLSTTNISTSQIGHAAHLKRDCKSIPDISGAPQNKQKQQQSISGSYTPKNKKTNRTTGYAARLRERLQLDT